jgi:hypothetical protein
MNLSKVRVQHAAQTTTYELSGATCMARYSTGHAWDLAPETCERSMRAMTARQIHSCCSTASPHQVAFPAVKLLMRMRWYALPYVLQQHKHKSLSHPTLSLYTHSMCTAAGCMLDVLGQELRQTTRYPTAVPPTYQPVMSMNVPEPPVMGTTRAMLYSGETQKTAKVRGQVLQPAQQAVGGVCCSGLIPHCSKCCG